MAKKLVTPPLVEPTGDAAPRALEARLHPRFPLEEVMAIEPAALPRVVAQRPEPSAGSADGAYGRVGTVAVIRIDGPLSQRGGDWWDGYEWIRMRFEAALRDPSVRAVVLRINSPGGVASGCFEAALAMRKAKAAAGKPVFAFADEHGYSAAYAIATCADAIYLPAPGGVGSVGVRTTLFDLSKANEEMGVRVVILASGAKKVDYDPALPLDDETIARWQARTNQLAAIFADVVAKARNMTPEDVLALEGACLYGKDAVRAGLADGVMSWDECMQLVQKKALTSAPRAAAPTETTMQTIARALGLKDDASEAECLAALTDKMNAAATAERVRTALEARVIEATGAKTVEAAFGVVAAWKTGAEQVPALTAKLAELDGHIVARDRDALIAEGVKAKKLTPALAEWAKTQSVESLKAFLEKAPAHAALSSVEQPASTPGTNASGASAPPEAPAQDLAGKRWEDLKPAQKHELHQTNKPLYDALKADFDRRTKS